VPNDADLHHYFKKNEVALPADTTTPAAALVTPVHNDNTATGSDIDVAKILRLLRFKTLYEQYEDELEPFLRPLSIAKVLVLNVFM
jgi:hypothetical protein